MEQIAFFVNGKKYALSIEPGESLNYTIRERLGLQGTKRGCDTGGCGSCTVIIDGNSVYSCMMYSMQVAGKKITTVEGLYDGANLDPLQVSFMDTGGLQCGYCTPGFLLSAKALLGKVPDPSDSEIRDALVGNLCRCTGYTKIFESIKAAALAYKKKNTEK
jgi:aerobic carbon-monoxide dehydrogenase small subunit